MEFVPLGVDADYAGLDDYASETLDEVVRDAVVRKYRTEGGFVLVTLWRNTVHEVIYQTPLRFFWSRNRRNKVLYEFYGEGQEWAEDWPIDFGTSHKRSDKQVRALYSTLMDYVTFVTVEFDRHRSDERWRDTLTGTPDPARS